MRCFPDKSVSLSEKRLNTIPVLIQHKSLALLFFLDFFLYLTIIHLNMALSTMVLQ